MGKLFKTFIHNLPQETLPEGLSQTILRRIEAFESRRASLRVFVLLIGSTVFGVIFASAIGSAGSALTQSGFWQYLSLISSDMGMLTSFWKELMLSLAATLPISALLLALASGSALIWSFASFIKNAQSKLWLARA